MTKRGSSGIVAASGDIGGASTHALVVNSENRGSRPAPSLLHLASGGLHGDLQHKKQQKTTQITAAGFLSSWSVLLLLQFSFRLGFNSFFHASGGCRFIETSSSRGEEDMEEATTGRD